MKQFVNFLAICMCVFFITNCNPKKVIDSDISESITWHENDNIVIEGTVRISNGATLTIEPGTIIKFAQGASLVVSQGCLKANGTSSKPIIFQSALESSYPGAWVGLIFESGTSANTILNYCKIEDAGEKESVAAVNLYDCKITLTNSILEDIKGNAIYLGGDANFSAFSNNKFENIQKHAIVMPFRAVPTIGQGNTFSLNSGYGVEITGGKIGEGILIWRKLSCPYYVTSTIYIDDNSTVTIEPGTIIKFDAGTDLKVGFFNAGTLKAEGTSTDNIVFTSAASSPTAGIWHGLLFYNGASNCSLKYCKILYAGNTSYYGAILIDGTSISMEYCNISHSNNYGVYCNDRQSGFISFNNNVFENIANHSLNIYADKVHTIGTNNVFDGTNNHGVEICGGYYTLTTQHTWFAQNVPYYITSNIYFDGNIKIEGTYKCNASVNIFFGNFSNCSAIVSGKFTSSATTPSYGNWGSLIFYSSANNSQLKNLTIEYGGGSFEQGQLVLYDYTILSADNVTIKYSQTCGVYMHQYSSLQNANQISFLSNLGGNICYE